MASRRCTSAARVAESGTISAKSRRAAVFCSQGASSARRGTASSLFATRITGLPGGRSARTALSAAPKRPASTTNRTTSTSPRVPVTARLRTRWRAAPRRVWKPGVSTKTNCAAPTVRMPVMRCRVVCALAEVMLIFWPTSALSSVDLPTFGRPTMATRPQRRSAAAVGAASPGATSPGPAGRAAIRTGAGCRAGRSRAGHRACDARPPARRRGATGLRRLRAG